ncbi:PHP domain-containing protein [Selenomonas sp. oral taxon 149]|uniref:PHP domain-containing protein n=1 Tax=Selenomonas sp. oral taxon 149 TaxID=712535 RepID=UPI0001E0AF9C|nr:PHP domain-containing protein [Selenomonas sp. oral taxon 149]EFM22235.1 PHP domain protein [Selenomonas sp. oral taxon 149 str. 67H29BP]
MPSDLHIHTTFSDGRNTPEEIMEAAKAAGLRYISITDHDSVEGVTELYESGHISSGSLRVIPGVGFSTGDGGHDVHILGYNIDIYDAGLQEKLEEISEARWTRFTKIVELLRGLGYEIGETEVLTDEGMCKAIGRSHVARVLVKKGYFDSVRTCFDQLLKRGQPAYVPHFRVSAEELISLIRGAGGIPVLANPKSVGDETIIMTLVGQGLQGVEAFYPTYDRQDTQHYLDVAQKYGLLVSGGSDYRGFPGRGTGKIGQFTIEDVYAENFYRPPQHT